MYVCCVSCVRTGDEGDSPHDMEESHFEPHDECVRGADEEQGGAVEPVSAGESFDGEHEESINTPAPGEYHTCTLVVALEDLACELDITACFAFMKLCKARDLLEYAYACTVSWYGSACADTDLVVPPALQVVHSGVARQQVLHPRNPSTPSQPYNPYQCPLPNQSPGRRQAVRQR